MVDDASEVKDECAHEFKGHGRTPYVGIYTETCSICGLTQEYEADYT